jgi:hypothetical protein
MARFVNKYRYLNTLTLLQGADILVRKLAFFGPREGG